MYGALKHVLTYCSNTFGANIQYENFFRQLSQFCIHLNFRLEHNRIPCKVRYMKIGLFTFLNCDSRKHTSLLETRKQRKFRQVNRRHRYKFLDYSKSKNLKLRINICFMQSKNNVLCNVFTFMNCIRKIIQMF